MSKPTEKEICPSCSHDISDHYVAVGGLVRCTRLHIETTGIRMPYVHSERCECRDYHVPCADCGKVIQPGEPRAFVRECRVVHQHCGKVATTHGRLVNAD